MAPLLPPPLSPPLTSAFALARQSLCTAPHAPKVVAAGTVLNWVADYVVVASFPLLTSGVGHAGSFGVYCGVNVLAGLFVFFLVPETKGLELEQIS